MTALLIYTGKVALLLAAFYLFYKWLLSRETFHRLNRRILTASLLLAALLPLVVVTLHRTVEIQENTPAVSDSLTEKAATEATGAVLAADVVTDGQQSLLHTLNWPAILFAIYASGVLTMLFHTLLSIFRIRRLIRQGELHRDTDGTPVIVTGKDFAPFSWMHWIVLSREDYQEASPFVLAHEKAHLRFGHSREVLLVELFCAMQWFNPAAWLLKRELRAIHEYEADDAVLSGGANVKAYQYSLIKKAVGMSGYSITNSFHHSTLKNRITMMSKSRSPRQRGLRALYLLPLAFCFLAATAQTVTNYKSSEKTSFYGIDVPHSAAPVEKQTEPVFFKMVKGDAVADTLFLYMRVFATEELDGLYAYGPIWKDDLPAVLKGSYHTVVLDAEASCRMGFVDDVKQCIREADLRKIRYTCPDAGTRDAVHRMLPPTEKNAKIAGQESASEMSVRKNDYYLLQINSRGDFRLAGKTIAADALEEAVTSIIRQNAAYTIGLQTDRATPFGSFIAAESAVTRSVNRLRDTYAQEHFGIPYDIDRLSEEQVKECQRAVPLRLNEVSNGVVKTR